MDVSGVIQSNTLKIVKLFDDVQLPEKKNPTDSGFDVFGYSFKKYYQNHGSNFERDFAGETLKQFIRDGEIELRAMDRILVGTGLKMTMGPGYELQVRPRSGLALKQGITVLNTPGTIDSTYINDEIGVIIVNLSRKNQIIKLGERIAQIVPIKVELPEIEIVDSLLGTDRGGGFGHTGK